MVRAKRDERERRQRAARVRLARRLVAIGAAIVGVMLVVTLVSRLPLFPVSDVVVAGSAHTDPAALRILAAVPGDATMLRHDRSGIVERLLGEPWVDTVRVSWRMPSTLVITVSERAPVAIVDAGDRAWWVGEGGMVLAEARFEESATVPYVRDVPAASLQPGVASDSPELVNAIEVVQGISSELRAVIRSVSAPSVSETTLVTRSGVEVMIGAAERLDEKSLLVLSILAEQGEGVVFIDVRTVERPISRGLDQ